LRHLSGFNATEVVIFQSLEPREVPTGDEVLRLIQGIGDGMPARLLTCENAGEFADQLRGLVEDARSKGSRPIIHIECHGDPEHGLNFANNSDLSWPALAHELRPLNEATGNNLLVVVSACFGAHFVGQMGPTASAPCLALVGPTGTIYPSEVLAGFRRFYTTLFADGDAGKAAGALSQQAIESGGWLWVHAEDWYQAAVLRYVEQQCTPEAMQARAAAMHERARLAGEHVDTDAIRAGIRQANQSDLVGEMFDRFFLVGHAMNRRRFDPARKRIEAQLQALRETGRYEL
jgi:hypothetical protein